MNGHITLVPRDMFTLVFSGPDRVLPALQRPLLRDV